MPCPRPPPAHHRARLDVAVSVHQPQVICLHQQRVGRELGDLWGRGMVRRAGRAGPGEWGGAHLGSVDLERRGGAAIWQAGAGTYVPNLATFPRPYVSALAWHSPLCLPGRHARRAKIGALQRKGRRATAPACPSACSRPGGRPEQHRHPPGRFRMAVRASIWPSSSGASASTVLGGRRRGPMVPPMSATAPTYVCVGQEGRSAACAHACAGR
jgi:hypothetical protein